MLRLKLWMPTGMSQCGNRLALQEMLLNDQANIRHLNATVPGVILDYPHGDAHIALALALAADRLNLRLVLGLGHKFSQNRRCPLFEATAVLANPDFVRRRHGKVERVGRMLPWLRLALASTDAQPPDWLVWAREIRLSEVEAWCDRRSSPVS
jgi:hypothetical protein